MASGLDFRRRLEDDRRARYADLLQGGEEQDAGGGDGLGLSPNYVAQGMEGARMPARKADALDRRLAEKERDVKGAAFDAAAGWVKGGSGNDTLAGGAGGDTGRDVGGAGGDAGRSAEGGLGLRQVDVDAPGVVEDTLSRWFTGESVSQRNERQLPAHARGAADWMASNADLMENPDAAYQAYKQGGGKLGSAMFQDVRRSEVEKARVGQVSDAKHREFQRAADYNRAMRSVQYTGNTAGLVSFLNEHHPDLFGGGLQGLEETEDGFTAKVRRRDQVVDMKVPKAQARAFMMGDQVVNQAAARAGREISNDAFVKYAMAGWPQPLAWKMAFGDDMPARKEQKPMGYDARGVPVYDSENIPAGGLYGEQLKHREPREPKERRLVDLPGGGKGYLNEDGSVEPIAATRPGPEQPSVGDRVSGIRTVMGKYAGAEGDASLDGLAQSPGSVAALMSFAKSSSYRRLRQAAEDGKDARAVQDLEWVDAALAELMNETRTKAAGWKAYK